MLVDADRPSTKTLRDVTRGNWNSWFRRTYRSVEVQICFRKAKAIKKYNVEFEIKSNI